MSSHHFYRLSLTGEIEHSEVRTHLALLIFHVNLQV